MLLLSLLYKHSLHASPPSSGTPRICLLHCSYFDSTVYGKVNNLLRSSYSVAIFDAISECVSILT